MDFFKASNFAGTPRAKLERTNAHKSIEFDVSGSVGRRGSRSSDVSYDLDSSSLREDDTPEDEFRIGSMRDVEDTNNKLRKYGLYTNTGISNELWESRRPSPDVSPIEGASPHWMRQDSLLFAGDDNQEPPPAASLSTSLGQLPRASSARELDVQRKAESAAQPVKKPLAEKKTSPLRHKASAKESPVTKLLDVVHKVMAGKAPVSQGHPYRTSSEPISRSPLGPQATEIPVTRKESKLDGRSLSAGEVDSMEPVTRIVSPPKPEAPSSSHAVPSKEQVQSPNNLTRPTRSQPVQPSGSLTLKLPPAMRVVVPRAPMSTSAELLGSLAPDFDEQVIAQNWSDSDRETDRESESENEVEDSPEVRPPVSEVEPQRGEQRNDVGHAGIASPHPDSNTFVIKEDHSGGTERVDVAKVGQNPDPELPEPPVSDPLELMRPKSPWTKGDLLGSGSYGSVYYAVDSNGDFFAVKEVSLVEQDKKAQASVDQLKQEIDLLSHFKHENIVQYLGTEMAHGKLYIFLELVSQGSLATVCRKIQLSESQISNYTRQILEGLKYLHDRRIVHRDIKCANILVDTRVCKLADFGMAKQISSLDANKSCKGSAYWMAPEVIDPKKTYGPPSDIWSLGCSILEMATQSPPFGEMEWLRVLWHVGNGNAPPIPDSLSPVAKDFVKRCLEVNATKRSTAAELLHHEFVRHTKSLASASSGGATFEMMTRDLQTIKEENSADVAGLQSSQGSAALVNGNSNRVQT